MAKKAELKSHLSFPTAAEHARAHALSRTHKQQHRSWLSQWETLAAPLPCRGCLAFGGYFMWYF